MKTQDNNQHAEPETQTREQERDHWRERAVAAFSAAENQDEALGFAELPDAPETELRLFDCAC